MQQLNSSHPAMACISNFSLADIETYIESIGEHNYRSKQIFTSLYDKKNIALHSFDAITVIPKYLREQLSKDFGPHFRSVILKNKQISEDGTCKMLFSLLDDTAIETVLIPSELVNAEGEPKRKTLCISTQAGCALGCAFCATATLKLRRNLAVSEIVDQFMAAREICDTQITNIVFMGMGEPLLNYDNVMKAVEILTDKEHGLMNSKHITLSTAGVIPGIIKMADQKSSIKLALSLHATTDAQRISIMPIAKKYSLRELGDALEYYYRKTKNPVTYEYILFQGVNDSEADAKRLAKITRRIPSKVNVIPFHEIEFTSPTGISATLKPAPEQTFLAFILSLKAKGVMVMIRSSSGLDIDAACGQLAFSNSKPLKSFIENTDLSPLQALE